MIETWIIITLLAAFSQNIRSTYQKKLKNKMSNISSTYTRFLFGLPFVLIYFLFLYNFSNTTFLIENINIDFLNLCFIGGVSQIVATFLLIKIFSNNNFSVATSYSKTEPIQAAFIGFIILNEGISITGLVGIVIGIIGIIITSFSIKDFKNTLKNYSVIYGLLSGSLFGLSSVLFRAASHNLYSQDYLLTSSFTLLTAITIQTFLLTSYILYRDIRQFNLVFSNLRDCFIVGFFGAFASIFWFYAMSIQNVAYVRALGQIELIFSLIISYFYFKERITLNQILGIFIIFLGLILILLYR